MRLPPHPELTPHLRQAALLSIQTPLPPPPASSKDEESFSSYIARMKKDACWAGNLELVAASNTLNANIHVHQSGQPRWVVGCVEGQGRPMHLIVHT